MNKTCQLMERDRELVGGVNKTGNKIGYHLGADVILALRDE